MNFFEHMKGFCMIALELKIQMSVEITCICLKKIGVEDLEMCIWPGSFWERQELPQPIQGDVYIQTKPQFSAYAR